MISTAAKKQALSEAYSRYLEQNPTARIRNAAADLGVSEMELLCLSAPEKAAPLQNNFEDFLKEVKTCGKVMALTRNEEAVHERKGSYLNVSFNPHAGLVLGLDIDLRLFMGKWKFGFAVAEPFRGEERFSFQFFDAAGQAVHKIYMTEHSDLAAYQMLREKYALAPDPTYFPEVTPAAKPVRTINPNPDLPGFQKAWTELKDTHDFYILLRNFRMDRVQALELAPEGYTRKMPAHFFKNILSGAAEKQVDIMVFVGNHGSIQIHTGPVQKLLQTGEWFNVLDEDFNLHLNENGISATWLVKKPTTDGMVNSVECYDQNGELIVQFFGKRKPGNPESEDWRLLLDACAAEQ
jgi:putative hemin transport protein